MLATIGFGLTGIMFGIFAYTFRSIVVMHTNLNLKAFSHAYYMLSLAFLLWAVAAAINKPRLLEFSVYMGDALILLGSIFMMYLAVMHNKDKRPLYAAVYLFIVLFALRAIFYIPKPQIVNGVLLFNTQLPVAAVLTGIFCLIWFPNNLRVSKQVTTIMKQKSIGSLYGALHGATTFSAIIFLSARRSFVVVSSFTILSLCILLLIFSNILVSKVMEKAHGKHAKQPAA
jgi:hypothetical protein